LTFQKKSGNLAAYLAGTVYNYRNILFCIRELVLPTLI